MAFLIDIGTAIVAKLAEYTVEPVIRQVGYVICYNKNLEELQTRVDDLVDAKTSMQHSVEAEERNGRIIETGVRNWLTKVDELTKKADDLKAKLAHTKCLFCPNLKLRHHLSRESTKLVQEVAELYDKKNSFDKIAYVDPLEEVCAIAIQDYEALDSRSSAAKDVINELTNSDSYMIGVYGIGGVGKTTLVKEVYNQLAARSEKLFDEVAMVLDLKQNPTIERIQKEIAEKLCLELPENGTSRGRARLISNRIKEKKTLVILDDVWESIDLEAVGLPRMATLKILLTSRDKIVLSSKMGTQKDFHLEVLNKEENWRLFQKMAGDIVENPDIRTIATQVAEECGGLPLLIVTVARSLKESPLYDWKDTLRRLKKLDGKELTDKAYSAIEWSYDRLDNELKSVLLLCASEAGSANVVSILDLLKYSTGLGLGFIKHVDTMEEARNALNSLCKKLQHSCLLLDTVANKWVRIHDLVKHVATQIAARDHHVLSVSHGSELKEWPNKKSGEKCSRISLMKCQTPDLPEVLQCPKLTMFHLSSVDVDSREIPSSFFKEMKKLEVLDLTNRIISSLPSSLKCLKDLQTLCLDQCTLGDIALVGELQNLKILSLLYSKFKQLPEEIGQLTRLQLLDLTGCSQLEMISPDVISKLKQLEELRMGKNSFNKWEAGRVGDTKRNNASLEELRDLSRLTAIQIHVPDANILPANLFTTSKLERFQICIGSVWKWDDVDEALNALKLKLTTNNELDRSLKMLLQKTQDLYLEGVDNKIFRELATGGYQQLKHLHVQNDAKFAYTINEKVCFPTLTWLAVSELNGQRFLFSSSVVRSLSKLKRLQISGCQIMEEIISIEESNQEIAENFFPQLQELELKGLPNLTKLCSTSYAELPNPSCERLQSEDCAKSSTICEEIEEMDSKRNLDIVVQHFLFDNKVGFPKLKSLSLSGLTKLTTIWNKQMQNTSAPPQQESFGCENLERVEIDTCDNLDNIFPSWVARNLQQLHILVVLNCGGVKEIIAREEGLQTTILKFVFPKVQCAIFRKLSQLVNFYPGMHVCSWPLLNYLGVYECDKVDILFAQDILSFQQKRDVAESSSTLVDRQSLFSIDKDSLPNLEILGVKAMEFSDGPLPAAAQLFGKLKKLDLYCPQSKSLVFLDKLLDPASPSHLLPLPHLKELRLVGMEELMHLGQDDEDANSQSATGIPNIPNLQILYVNGCHGLRNLRSSAISFDNLTTLQVSLCYRLKYLVTYSTASSLMQLTTLEVDGCPRLEQIVGSNDDDESRKEITFPRLKHLKLSSLPRLQRFCSRDCIAKFPTLETSTMSNRLKVKIFATDSQTLQLITDDGEETDVDVWEPILAATEVMESLGLIS